MSVPIRVLMVEDSEDDCALIARELREGGYDIQFTRVDTPENLKAAVCSQKWDLVISAFSASHFSGPEVLQLVKGKHPEVPFFFVSGTIGEATAVAAMQKGAQDYLMKGNLKRLVPEVQREMREAEERRERKRLEQHLQQLRKFEAVGRLAGGVAHDFNNVIGAILGWAELGYGEAEAGSSFQQRFQKIREQAQRAARLTSQLLAFARRQLLQPRKLNLNILVREEMNLLEKVIGADLEIKVHVDPDLRVTLADPAQIEQVIMNLCLNARDAMPQGGKLIIETRNVEIGEEFCKTHAYGRPGAYVLLAVSDTGIGMDTDTLDHIFEPFFTTKEIGKRTGLGLATVYGIVKQHGGFIYAYSEPGKGTTFRVYLRADIGEHESLETPVDESPLRGSETILLAEDHDGLRDSVQEMLQSLGYKVVSACDGPEALRLFTINRDAIDLVVMDVVMPWLSGPDAYAKMSTIQPGIRVIFTTGYTAEAASLISILDKGAMILQKPYNLSSLSRMIRGALDRVPVT